MWHLSSRVHPLNNFPNDGLTCYIKRDDELGCGLSGTKVRKYSSLMPFLMQQGIQHLIIIAGPQSNNLLAALQVAREFNFKVTAFLIRPWKLELRGNFKLSSLFLEEQEIVWVARSDWSKVNELALNYLNALNEKGFVLHEGASVPAAMPGALTLAKDIVVNEQSLGVNFQHIFIDAGTGFSAAALIKGLVAAAHQATVHVLLLADDERTFKNKLKQWIEFEPQNYHCFYPTTAKAFGVVNQTVKTEVRRMALEEGILVSPIYSAKLFYETRQFLVKEHIIGNVLIIHSGGILSMHGFDY